jgi:hypothetical protein
MELYIQKLKVIESGNNVSASNAAVTDNSKSWTTNQWVNYYVYILSGTGQGQIAKITSNGATRLYFAELPIFLDSTSIYQIVDFVFKRVEMFQDEKVSVTSSIQNYADIGKLFTDYSQSFTIPASPTNNAIFSHWYDNAVDNGYDARIRYNAFIEIDTIPFRSGNVQLEKANKKNGYIESYTLTFYGNLTQLKDKFGDDKLNSLDYSSLNHTYDATTVIAKINSNTGDVKYPLIGNVLKFEYKTASIFDVTTDTGAINWNDLFPAISISKIFEFIQNKYGITFTGNFLSYQQFTKLNLFLKNSELPRSYNAGVFYDQNRFSGTATFPEYNSATDTITSSWTNGLWPSFGGVVGGNKKIRIMFRTIPQSGFTNTNYKVDLYQDGVVIKSFDNLIGETLLTLLELRQSEDSGNHTYRFKISALGGFTFKAAFSYIRDNSTGDATTNSFNYASSGSPANQTFSAIQQISNYVPDIKVADFFMAIVKMFNLIITPIDANTFKLQPLELYYQEGEIKDLTQYIYSDELDIEKPKLFKSIEFSYEKSENILNNAYAGLYNKQYGDLVYDSGSNSETGKYEIKLPFEDVMFEKATGYDFITATLLNKDLQPYTPKPILMYNNGLTNVSSFPIKIFNGTTYTSINNYVRFNNDIALGATDTSYVNTINWNAEVSPWFLTVAPDGLYKRHYEQYISNLYNQKTRVLKVKAKLEPRNLTNLKLNDRIIIRDNRYIINSFTTDLTTGEASLELINDYRVLGYNSVGYRFANIELLNVDNTSQEVKVDIYKGLFEYVLVPNQATGFVTCPSSGTQTDDFTVTVSIAQNTTGLDRIEDFSMKFQDYEGNVLDVNIPVKQKL